MGAQHHDGVGNWGGIVMKTVDKRGGAVKAVFYCFLLALLLVGNLNCQCLDKDKLLDVRLGFASPDARYMLNPPEPNADPIITAVTIENVSGRELLATKGFADNLHLLLRFADPDGFKITGQRLLPRTFSKTQPVIPDEENKVNVMVEKVEVVATGDKEQERSFSIEFNARDFYKFRIPGRHKAQVFVPVGLYETKSQVKGTHFARLSERIFGGDLISNAITITLIDDADKDGACFPQQHPLLCPNQPKPDCEDRPAGADGVMGTADDGAKLNPRLKEIPNNGIDDDCNPATLDSPIVKPGALKIKAVE
jgi:hypothetical protein